MPRRTRHISPSASNGDHMMDFVDSMLDGFCEHDEPTTGTEVPEIKHKSKNLEAERRRRKKLNGNIYDLRAIVPKITKMSKESALNDAIDYILQLQKSVQDLQAELSMEEEAEKQGSASSTTERKPPLQQTIRFQGKFELVQMGSNKFHVKTTCENKRGGFTVLLEAVSRLGLEVAQVSSMAFSGVSQSVMCVEAKDGDVVPLSELKKLLEEIVGASSKL